MTDPFARLGSWMARKRAFVLIAWAIVAIVCAVVFAPRAGGVLKAGGVGAPGSESDIADRTAEAEFGASVVNNISIVFQSDDLTVDDPNYAAEVQAVSDRLAAMEDVKNVISFYNLGDPTMVSEDRKTTFLIAALEGDEGQTQELIPDVRATLDETTLDWYVTGLPAINEDFQHTSEEDLRRSELVTIPIVMILLLVVFRTIISAAIPLFIGAASVLLALTAIYFVGSNANVSGFALNVASMIGLGLGIDFSLIVVSRYREEMAKGYDRVSATAITMATAGRSITYSGITVVLSMLIMTVMFDLIIIRSIAMGVTIVAATSLIAGLTLLPAMMAALHHRLEWLRVIPRSKNTGSAESGFWYGLSRTIMRRPMLWLSVSLAILLALAYPVLNIKMIGADPGTLPQDIESVRGARIMEAEYGEARLTPVQIIMQSDEANGVWTAEFLAGLAKLTEAIEADERVQRVDSFPAFLRSPAGASKNNLPPGTLHEMVLYKHGEISRGPHFMGLARMTLEPGFELPTAATDAIHVIHVSTGSLTFQTDGPATISERPSDPYPPSSAAPVSTPFALQAEQNLIVNERTPTSIRNDSGAPVEVVVGVIYKVAPSEQTAATSWTSEPNSDLFATVPKEVISAGIVTDLPEGSVDFLIDELTFAPASGRRSTSTSVRRSAVSFRGRLSRTPAAMRRACSTSTALPSEAPFQLRPTQHRRLVDSPGSRYARRAQCLFGADHLHRVPRDGVRPAARSGRHEPAGRGNRRPQRLRAGDVQRQPAVGAGDLTVRQPAAQQRHGPHQHHDGGQPVRGGPRAVHPGPARRHHPRHRRTGSA